MKENERKWKKMQDKARKTRKSKKKKEENTVNNSRSLCTCGCAVQRSPSSFNSTSHSVYVKMCWHCECRWWGCELNVSWDNNAEESRADPSKRIAWAKQEMCTVSWDKHCANDIWTKRLWQHLSNENEEEKMLRHKGDPPATNFIEHALGRKTDQRYCCTSGVKVWETDCCNPERQRQTRILLKNHKQRWNSFRKKGK